MDGSGNFPGDTQELTIKVNLPALAENSKADPAPYWASECTEAQNAWWLPHHDGDEKNFVESDVDSWKSLIEPLAPTATALNILLPKGTKKTPSAKVLGTRKIRVFPKDEAYLWELVRQHRRAYNLAIACFVEADRGLVDRQGKDLKKIELRRTIRDFVQSEVEERGGAFASAACDEAVLNAYRTRDAVIEKRKRGEKCGFSFKSMKDIRQGFLIQKLTVGFVAKNFDLSEQLPEEAFLKITRIVSERGQWFICAQKHITTVGQDEIQVRSIVAIDPGVRTFATAYSVDHCIAYGKSFYETRIWPLILKIDQTVGQRARARNDQWKRHYQKRLDRLAVKVRNLVDDLHRRVAFDLVRNFDVLLLPTFETSEMVKKQERKLRTKTARSMLGLGHFRFQQKLQWMCRKYGKRLVLINEAYTSKTRSWDGYVHRGLGGAKTIGDGKINVDRDLNGARGIMLRALYGNLGQIQAANATDVAFVAD